MVGWLVCFCFVNNQHGSGSNKDITKEIPVFPIFDIVVKNLKSGISSLYIA